MLTTEHLQSCIDYARSMYQRVGHMYDVFIVISGTTPETVQYRVVDGNVYHLEEWRVLWSAELDAIHGDGLVVCPRI